ncbi:hypothetical protein AGABI2DRAFT_133207 [Agaricus bisporus var. bisporus H97]|uniref:hypothetical protein n=1 Tax=Agaricus bisporus var. bisporus (strain H97 / ATCC MYA-4626 / FGSC 10389) TaxID=936046 RepID=UPI00029F7848|nr:hypothetical protein AGABI2DRAFT_133207 [Agaricus bisporus var. bisporus H97]EKV51543.1 hypothetical protein AGABI2DRAFT_133207 [Agaricus bisporus var. bisporus H97]
MQSFNTLQEGGSSLGYASQHKIFSGAFKNQLYIYCAENSPSALEPETNVNTSALWT